MPTLLSPGGHHPSSAASPHFTIFENCKGRRVSCFDLDQSGSAPDDAVIMLYEIAGENASFDHGLAQSAYIEPPS